MLAMTRNSPLTGLAAAAFVIAALWWILLAGYSAAGEHISSTAEDVAFVLAVIAAVAFIVAGVVYGLRSAPTGAALLRAGGVLVIVIAFIFGPTTW